MVHGSMTDLGWINKTDYKRKFTLFFSQVISIKEYSRQCEFAIRQPSERWDFFFIGPVWSIFHCGYATISFGCGRTQLGTLMRLQPLQRFSLRGWCTDSLIPTTHPTTQVALFLTFAPFAAGRSMWSVRKIICFWTTLARCHDGNMILAWML